ncbi:unnamed protein product [Arctogadus glacialis]
MVDVGTQTEWFEIQRSTPLASPEQRYCYTFVLLCITNSRLLLAALHFNSNGSGDVARTSEGYATNLMVSLVEEYSISPQALQGSSAVLSSAAPPPLTTSLQKVAKDEAVSLHLA